MNRQGTKETKNILLNNVLHSSGIELNTEESIQGTPRFGVPFFRLESHVTVRTDEHGSASGYAAQFRRTNRIPINNGQHTGPARGKTGVIPFLGPAIEKQMMKASAQARAFRESTARSQASHSQSRAVESYDRALKQCQVEHGTRGHFPSGIIGWLAERFPLRRHRDQSIVISMHRVTTRQNLTGNLLPLWFIRVQQYGFPPATEHRG